MLPKAQADRIANAKDAGYAMAVRLRNARNTVDALSQKQIDAWARKSGVPWYQRHVMVAKARATLRKWREEGPSQWKRPVLISLVSARDGGLGQSTAMFYLREANIPCRKAESPYIGHTAVEVPEIYYRRAEKALFGN